MAATDGDIEAFLRAAARRADADLGAGPAARSDRRGIVVTAFAGLALLGVAVWPTASAYWSDQHPPRTAWQHAPAGDGGWDPWVDPMADPWGNPRSGSGIQP